MSTIDPIYFLSIRTWVIVVHDGNMLLLSPLEPGAGWRLPGGGLELDESPLSAANAKSSKKPANHSGHQRCVSPRMGRSQILRYPRQRRKGYGMEVSPLRRTPQRSAAPSH